MNIITAIGSILVFIFYPMALILAAVLGVLVAPLRWALGTTITIKSDGAKIGTLRWFKYTKI